MSYSRWSNSKFYTFYHVSNDIKNDQIFDVMFAGEELQFTYKELKNNINDCIDKCHDISPITEAERSELKKYMLRFIKDVESDPLLVSQ